MWSVWKQGSPTLKVHINSKKCAKMYMKTLKVNFDVQTWLNRKYAKVFVQQDSNKWWFTIHCMAYNTQHLQQSPTLDFDLI